MRSRTSAAEPPAWGWVTATNEERAVAVHEAGHAVGGECFGWRVVGMRLERTKAGGWPPGYISAAVSFGEAAPSPLADLAVSCLGHAMELYRLGKGRVPDASGSDRRAARVAFRRCGVTVSAADLAELERRLSGLPLVVGGVWPMVRRVADALLGPTGELSRSEFLRVAGPRLKDRDWRRAVTEACKKAALSIWAEVAEG